MSNKNNENLSPTSFEASTDVDLLDYETAFKDLVEQDPQLQTLIEEAKRLQAEGKIEEIEGYVGSGGNKDVIAYNGMALKLKRSEARRDIAKQVEPLLEGKGVADLEQLIAVDNENGVALTTLHDGTPISKVSAKDLLKIKRPHLARLHTALDEMRARGLHPHNMGGVLFDEESGFSFVDYEKSDDEGVFNRGDMNSTESFLRFMLEDHEKFDELNRWRFEMGAKIPASEYKTTGVRALTMNVVLRRYEKLRKTTQQ